MKRVFSPFLAGLLFSAAAQAFPAGAHAPIREHIYDMYPQTASALPLQRTRGDFAIGRALVFGVNGNPRSYASALVYLRSAAARHYAPAQTLMGFMYAKGDGVPKSDAMARQWYQLAAKQGYARAQINLGNMYAKRLGVSDDVIRAYACYAGAKSHSQLGTVSYRDANSGMIRLSGKMTPIQLSTVHRIVGGYQARCIAN
ncbi:MAG: tetratricopeptide repeat protein [Metallibacterium sp.]